MGYAPLTTEYRPKRIPASAGKSDSDRRSALRNSSRQARSVHRELMNARCLWRSRFQRRSAEVDPGLQAAAAIRILAIVVLGRPS